jgi:MFS family permease
MNSYDLSQILAFLRNIRIVWDIGVTLMKQNYLFDKNFILLFSGTIVSGIGSRMYGFAISLYLLDLTGKATVASIYVSIWTIVLFVWTPIAATFTDRWKNKVGVLSKTDIGRGLVYLMTSLLLVVYQDNSTTILLIIYVSLFLVSIQSAFFVPASTALIPQIINEDDLVSANGIMQLTRSLQNIAGLALGAFLYLQYGIVPLIYVNGISFLVSGYLEMKIQITIPKNQKRLLASVAMEQKQAIQKPYNGMVRIYNDLRDSIRYLMLDSKQMGAVVLIMLVSISLLEPYQTIGVPYLLKEHLTFESNLPEVILASIKSIEAFGVIGMSLLVAFYISNRVTIYTLFRQAAVCYIVIGFATVFVMVRYDQGMITESSFMILLFLIYFIAGATKAMITAPFKASIVKYVDPNKIGKVSSMMDTLGGILLPISVLLFGLLIDFGSIYMILYLMLLGYILIFVIVFWNKHIRTLQ